MKTPFATVLGCWRSLSNVGSMPDTKRAKFAGPGYTCAVRSLSTKHSRMGGNSYTFFEIRVQYTIHDSSKTLPVLSG